MGTSEPWLTCTDERKALRADFFPRALLFNRPAESGSRRTYFSYGQAGCAPPG